MWVAIASMSARQIAGWALGKTMLYLSFPVIAVCTSATGNLRIGAANAATRAGSEI